MIRTCGRCRHGITAIDGTQTYTVCALLPPTRNAKEDPWERPPMSNAGWCGQFKLSWLRLFGYGARS